MKILSRLALFGLFVAIAVPARAEVLCVAPSGALSARAECRGNETPVDPAALGLVGPQGPQGVQGEIGPQGPAGTGPVNQHCALGTSVTGFDAEGDIVCGAIELTLEFESQYLDLDSGAVFEDFAPPPAADLHFAYNAGAGNHIRLFQEFGAEIAFLDATPFDGVGASVIPTVTFTASPLDYPFDFDDTILVRTALGNVFKVGKAVDNGDFTVTFSYAKLQ